MRNYILVFITFFVFSCSNDDTNSVAQNSELDGTWVLTNAVCFCSFGDDFDFSQHQLTFNTTEGTVQIENSVNTFFIIPQTGQFSFEVNGEQLLINNSREYFFEIEGDVLTLTFVDDPNTSDDELTLLYTRV